MRALIIAPKTAAEMKLLTDMCRKMNINTKVMTADEQEDYALGKLIESVDRTKKVSLEATRKMLRK